MDKVKNQAYKTGTQFANPFDMISQFNIPGLEHLAKQAAPEVLTAIKVASRKTGIDFGYLVQQAATESSFRTDVKARTSSATGLYQFIDKTWLSMVEKHGDKYGITATNRADILELRKDPALASAMAAELAAENKAYLQRHTSLSAKEIGGTELYLAHFLGAGQAAAFINARAETPLAKAADIFPAAAKANKAIFYEKNTQRALTLSEIHAHFDKKFGNTASQKTVIPVTKNVEVRMKEDAEPDLNALLAANETYRRPAPIAHNKSPFAWLNQRSTHENPWLKTMPAPSNSDLRLNQAALRILAQQYRG